MTETSLLTTIDADGRATLTLNRPEVANAFDERLIAALRQTLHEVEADDRVRVVVLQGSGSHFCAGADLAMMRRAAAAEASANQADALALGELLQTLDRLAKPTVALVRGAAYGGGIGLVAACDIVLAADTARFCFSEVRLGLIPAVISPYVVAAIGPRATRRYFLSAERFDAAEARRLGLVHETSSPEKLGQSAAALIDSLLDNGPEAMAAAKRLVAQVVWAPIGEELIADTAGRLAERRASAEGREGLAAFLEKRPPSWVRK